MINYDQQYSILHDNNKTLCFVGDTGYNRMLYQYWSSLRSCDFVSLEHVVQQSPLWVDRRQFMCAVSNVAFKHQVVDALSKFQPDYFSVIGMGNILNHVKIGRGTFIQNYNIANCNDTSIGDHCTLASFINLSHQTTIGDYCHVSSYAFINHCIIKTGNLFAVRCTVLGQKDQPLVIVDHCNFMIGSTIRKDVSTTGTYLDHKKISEKTSLNYKLF
jgi:hypothetical protein